MGLTECKTADEVRALYRAVSKHKYRQLAPRRARCVKINDLSPEPAPIPITRIQPTVVFQTFDQAQLTKPDVQTFPTVGSIIRLVSSVYGVSKTDILSRRKDAGTVRPRQVAAYLASTLTPHSFPQIGRFMGGRDHTTILHARDKIRDLRLVDAELDKLLVELELQLGGPRPSVKLRQTKELWSPQMDRLLRRLCRTNATAEDIALKINSKFGTDLTNGAVSARIWKRGLRRKHMQQIIPEAA